MRPIIISLSSRRMICSLTWRDLTSPRRGLRRVGSWCTRAPDSTASSCSASPAASALDARVRRAGDAVGADDEEAAAAAAAAAALAVARRPRVVRRGASAAPPSPVLAASCKGGAGSVLSARALRDVLRRGGMGERRPTSRRARRVDACTRAPAWHHVVHVQGHVSDREPPRSRADHPGLGPRDNAPRR